MIAVDQASRSPRRAARLTPLAWILLIAGPAAAELDSDALYFAELPIVATVSRLPQRQNDAPAAVTVIDRAMIKASGARSLNDVFRLVPGFQTYPHNTEPARVVYHGLTDESYSPRLQVLVDGRSLYSPFFQNGVNWAVIPVAMEDIERIEVVRGTNAVSYGANAFLGVINIITSDAALARGGRLSFNHGTQGVRDAAAHAGVRLGKLGDLRITFQRSRDDGLTDRYDWIDGFSSRLFDLRADLQLSTQDTLQLGAGRTEATTINGRLLTRNGQVVGPIRPSSPLRDFDQYSSYAQMLWRRALYAGSELELRYTYVADRASDEHWVHDEKTLLPLFPYDPEGGSGRRHELELHHLLLLDEHTRLMWGASWRQDKMQSEVQLQGQGWVARRIGRLFSNLEWRAPPTFTLNAGLSLEDDSLAGRHMASRLAGNFHLDRANTLRLAYARAYRTGSIVDYRGERWEGSNKYQFVGNPDLPVEKMDSYELGYLGNWRELKLSLDVRAFLEKIADRLYTFDLDRDDKLIPDTTDAIQDISLRGIEMQARWQPTTHSHLIVNHTIVTSKVAFLPAVAPEPPSSNINAFGNLNYYSNVYQHTLYSAPRRQSSLLLMHRLPWNIEASLAYYRVGRSKWSRNTWADPYERVDLRLAYPFKSAGLHGEVAWTVQSLNGDHREYKAYGQVHDRIVGRRQWLTLTLEL